jgi:[ribosomal protein S5]-alanine N-acetyltransferase
VARERVSGEVAGVINVNEIVAGTIHSAYLGYYGRLKFSGKGLVNAALRTAVEYVFDDLGLHWLEANMQLGNRASIALVRRLEFQMEGFSSCYLRIKGEWQDQARWALPADMLEAG